MPPVDPYRKLLRKARRDARHALRFLPDVEVDDEYVGFCCQQAVEKAIKCVLTYRGVGFRRTHDLSELVELAVTHAIDLPAEVSNGARALTPFAVEFRYDELPDVDDGIREAFNREEAVRIAAAAVAWAEALVGKD